MAALESGEVRTARPLLLDRAQTLTGRIAGRVDGTVAGEARRWHEPRRLAVVVPTTRPLEVTARFDAVPEIVGLVDEQVGMTVEGMPVELVVAPPRAFGTALLRATGPPSTSLRWTAAGGGRRARSTGALGLPYLRAGASRAPPRGAGDARRARRHPWRSALPHRLVGRQATVLELASAARGRGYEYVAICDHTRSVRVVPGLDADDLRRQAEEIAAANERLAPFRVLRGSECDIRPDGTLDLPDDVLAGPRVGAALAPCRAAGAAAASSRRE